MIKVIALFLIITTSGFAECNLATDIKKVEGGYLYSVDCHLLNGKVYKELDARREQVDKLEKAIELKDLAIDLQVKRVDLWQRTADSMENKLNHYEKLSTLDRVFHFTLGVFATGIAVYGASKLAK